MELSVKPLADHDPGRGLTVVSRQTLAELGLDSGDFFLVRGSDGNRAVTQVMPSDDIDDGIIRTNDLVRRTAGVAVGEPVTVEPVEVSPADSVTVALPKGFDDGTDFDLSLREELISRAVVVGQVVPVTLRSRTVDDPARRTVPVRITAASPGDIVLVRDWTRISVAPQPAEELSAAVDSIGGSAGVTFADIGGLDEEITQIRETVELPLCSPDAFDRLGVEPTNGVLLYGPPGTGKRLIVQAISNEADIHVETVSGPAIVSANRSETADRLRNRFENAAANEPAVVFIDELHAIAGTRDDTEDSTDGVGPLVSLMDDFEADNRLVVIGTTTQPETLDPALRRSGRFDTEIEIGVPDRDGREEILRI
ncbi:AAA family ATPase [Natrinema sp. SYSU A 869]|uniref:AAA family ATPase n=1 Tax=Natrinema sp. SYSU A 869 TaxID=2871694 RepID=UPI00210846AB|nr:AAA family ATPase [Natrinema sp. SYSU A 869]